MFGLLFLGFAGLLILGAVLFILKLTLAVVVLPFKLLVGIGGILLTVLLIVPLCAVILGLGIALLPLLFIGLVILAPLALIAGGIWLLLHA